MEMETVSNVDFFGQTLQKIRQFDSYCFETQTWYQCHQNQANQVARLDFQQASQSIFMINHKMPLQSSLVSDPCNCTKCYTQ